MRQQVKPGTRKARTQEKNQAKRNSKTFVGKCSNCGDRDVTVTPFRNGQLCVNKCLTGAIARLGGPQAVSAEQPITVAEV
jgi:hypothetical protein